MTDSVITIDIPDDLDAAPAGEPTETSTEPNEEATVAEIPAGLAASRPGPGRPRKAAGVAVSRTGTNGKAPAKASAKAAVQKGKPALQKKTAGKDTKVKGAAEGTTLTANQAKAVEKITKLLSAVNDAEAKKSTYMWDVAEQIHLLLTPADAKSTPVKQKDLARHIGVDPTNISIWAKNWRLFGDPKNRVTVNGVEASFNDHVERARMLNDDGSPADKDLYDRIEQAVEENGTSFAVAKRTVRQGPSTASIDVAGARDRVGQFASKLNELAGPTPNDEAITMALFAMQDAAKAASDIIGRRIGNGDTFTVANKQFMDGFEAQIGSLVDQIRKH